MTHSHLLRLLPTPSRCIDRAWHCQLQTAYAAVHRHLRLGCESSAKHPQDPQGEPKYRQASGAGVAALVQYRTTQKARISSRVFDIPRHTPSVLTSATHIPWPARKASSTLRRSMRDPMKLPPLPKGASTQRSASCEIPLDEHLLPRGNWIVHQRCTRQTSSARRVQGVARKRDTPTSREVLALHRENLSHRLGPALSSQPRGTTRVQRRCGRTPRPSTQRRSRSVIARLARNSHRPRTTDEAPSSPRTDAVWDEARPRDCSLPGWQLSTHCPRRLPRRRWCRCNQRRRPRRSRLRNRQRNRCAQSRA
eukprot:scaffold156177_cov31-Tisochrysis_lutea.AAC.1